MVYTYVPILCTRVHILGTLSPHNAYAMSAGVIMKKLYLAFWQTFPVVLIYVHVQLMFRDQRIFWPTFPVVLIYIHVTLMSRDLGSLNVTVRHNYKMMHAHSVYTCSVHAYIQSLH